MGFINQVKKFATSPWGMVSIALFFFATLCIKLFLEKG
jgi:hypothetical protein